jgi:hypothetical protein
MSEDNEPQNDKPKSAPPEQKENYTFSKVWIPIGIALATLGCGIMYLLSLHNTLKSEVDKNGRILRITNADVARNRIDIDKVNKFPFMK